jgi:glyoxylase-like metal-dependent hydrolase (beta-lactamase superfamily II)
MTDGNKPSDTEIYIGKIHDTKLLPVKDGYIFNLGGRRIQVMETPGHTPGSICFLDIGNKLLFTGDNNNTLVWLFLQNCRPLHEYLVTLEKQLKRLDEFTSLLPGVKGILDGSLERKPYKSFAGEAMASTFGKSSVAFNPDNL